MTWAYANFSRSMHLRFGCLKSADISKLLVPQNSVFQGFDSPHLDQKIYVLDPLTQKRMKNNGELQQYYLEGSHPGIVDRETWECVQLEIMRQEAYCREHHFWRYHHHNEENPLSSRITCSICGSTFMQLRSEKTENEGWPYWCCTSMFTPAPRPLTSKNPDNAYVRCYRKHHRKLPAPRQMFCTDIQVPAEEADKAFMRAWNFLVSHGVRYIASFREMARDGKDERVRHRAREMAKLLERGRIREFAYELMLRVLSHIEVTPVGKLAVIFLTGTRVTV